TTEDQGEGLAIPVDPHHTPIDPVPSTSQPLIPSTTEPPHSSPPRTEGATTTITGLDAGLDSGNIHKSPLRSHDVPIPEDNTSGSVEDNLKLKELMEIVPKLESKVDSLEKELKETKHTLGNVVLTLVKKVKSLEVALKRKTKKMVASKTVSTYKRRARSTKKGKDISTGLDAEVELNTGSTQLVLLVYCKRYNKKRLILQNGLDAEIELNTDSTEVNTGSNGLLTKRISEELELSKQQLKRKAQVQEAAQYYIEEDWDTIIAKLEANAELTKSLQGENVSSDDFAKKMVDMINQKKKFYAEQKARARRNKPMTQAQQRDYMSTFIKNQSSWKMAQLKKLTFKELKFEFEKLMKTIERFVPMGSEERVKRQGVQLEQDSSKKQKIVVEDVPTAQHEVEEDMEALMKDNDTNSSSGTDIPTSAVPVAIKPPSIANWKIIKLGKKGVYQIIREDGTYITYINFGAMLKSISRDDLTELYRLVMQRELYFVKFIINPEKDEFVPEVILGRSFLRLSQGVVDFGNEEITIYLKLDPFEDDSEKTGKSSDNWDQLLDFNFDDVPKSGEELPSFMSKMGKSNQEAAKEELAIRISQRYALLEEERHVIETMAYNDKYKKILDKIWKDKVELDGKTVKEDEEAVKRIKGEALKEKEDPSAFIFPIRLEGKVNENALADTGSDINTMPYRIFETLGREDMKKIDKGITMIDHTQAKAMGKLSNVLCQVGVTTIIAKFLILDIPIDRDAPIVVGRGFLRAMAESDSDDEEEYVIKRNKFGAPIYGPRPAPYLNCANPEDRSSAIQAVTNPFKKISVWKKAVSFLGSLPVPLKQVNWKPDYKGSYTKEEEAT
ncbi:DNA-directed DNA polymerase, partial [Tanacetum coccineum]